MCSKDFREIRPQMEVVIAFKVVYDGPVVPEPEKIFEHRAIMRKGHAAVPYPEIEQISQDEERIQRAALFFQELQEQAVVFILFVLQMGIGEKYGAHEGHYIRNPGTGKDVMANLLWFASLARCGSGVSP